MTQRCCLELLAPTPSYPTILQAYSRRDTVSATTWKQLKVAPRGIAEICQDRLAFLQGPDLMQVLEAIQGCGSNFAAHLHKAFYRFLCVTEILSHHGLAVVVVIEVAEEEESVLLPCQYHGHVPDDPRMKWTRSDISPNIVHQRREEDDLKGQNQRYKGRTWMNPDALDSSDFSLTLRKPTLADSGNYTCSISDGRQEQRLTEVQLQVKDQHRLKDFRRIFSTYFVLLFTFLIVLQCFFITLKDLRPIFFKLAMIFMGVLFLIYVSIVVVYYSLIHLQSDYQVYAGSDADSVLLPCSTTLPLSEKDQVEWTDSKNDKVHVYQNGSDRPELQSQMYRERTEMNKDPLKTGDLSLTLKHPQVTDIFICTIYRDEGNRLLKKYVRLDVSEVKDIGAVIFITLTSLFQLAFCLGSFYNAYKRIDQREVVPGAVQLGQSEVMADSYTCGPDCPRLTADTNITLDFKCPSHHRWHLYQKQDSSDKTTTNTITDDKTFLPAETLEVTEGVKSVLLPFKTRPRLPKDATVEWRYSASRPMKVHVYQRGQTEPDHQDQVYQGRTEMNKDPMRTGDVSLTLKNPRLTDSGVYTCFIYKKDGILMGQKVVILQVTGLQIKVLEVIQGVEFVQLPFKISTPLPGNIIVEWRRSDFKDMKIHVYQRVQDQPGEQDQVYQGRTEMNEDPLSTGDLSLTLKAPTPADTGVYTCIVFNTDGITLNQKVVALKVKFFQTEKVELTEGVESVLLPFKTSSDLPKDVTVDWRRSDYKNMKIYEYQRGQKQPHIQDQEYQGLAEMVEDPLGTRDLSLILKTPRSTDTGVYTCTVYSRDGHILTRKIILLCVKGNRSTMVAEVFCGKKKLYLDPTSPSQMDEEIPLMADQRV
ncbi:uncharacterized protein KZ484_023478 [Pholidichthys leucotaenia]